MVVAASSGLLCIATHTELWVTECLPKLLRENYIDDNLPQNAGVDLWRTESLPHSFLSQLPQAISQVFEHLFFLLTGSKLLGFSLLSLFLSFKYNFFRINRNSSEAMSLLFWTYSMKIALLINKRVRHVVIQKLTSQDRIFPLFLIILLHTENWSRKWKLSKLISQL